MSNTRRVHVGVDVGGTNTDAVVFCENEIIGWSKQVTTDDVTTGVVGAIISALDCAANFFDHGSYLIIPITRMYFLHFVLKEVTGLLLKICNS